MRTALFVLMIFCAAFLTAQDVNLEKTGESPVSAKFASGGQIRMEICPSQVNLTGGEENELRVDYDGGSRDEDVKVRLRTSGSHADLKVTGCPSNNFRITVQVPKTSNLYFRMFAGQLNLDGITGDKDVEMHAGQITMDVGKPEDYFRADGSVLTGDLQAAAFNVSKSGLFRSFEQGGPGKYRLHVHVGAGQITLR
jgi:hypothetical protein